MNIEIFKNFVVPVLTIIFILISISLIRKFKLLKNNKQSIIVSSIIVFIFYYSIVYKNLRYAILETLCTMTVITIPILFKNKNVSNEITKKQKKKR